jgi:branched-chain amino acid transport system ATP-binding protein
VSTVAAPARATAALEASAVSVGYGANPVVRNLDLVVHRGEVVALLGANGAGKTTTLLGLVGALRPLSGDVRMHGQPATGPLHLRARKGLAFVPEERSIIFALSVIDNLRIGRGDLDVAFEAFPELKRLRRRAAGTLSGGEQQMLTYARALSRRPTILVADELSLGLAPLIVARLGEALRSAASTGVAVLIVEQQVRTALAVSDRAYVLQTGEIILSGASDELAGRMDEIEVGYLSG